MSAYQKKGFWIGILFFIGILVLPTPADLSNTGWIVAAIATLMAIWWATEAIPVAVTALLPLALFPLFDITGFKEAAVPYSNPNIFLFLGGFILALAIEATGLHKRMALTMILSVGRSASSLIGGFMLVAALISMFVMNTSTTLMLLPIGLAVCSVVSETIPNLSEEKQRHFDTALLLGIAYAANIGGIATLIGTAPNMALNGFMEEQYNVSISFVDWMKVGVPVSLTLLPLAWLSLTRMSFPVSFQASIQTQEIITNMKSGLGEMKTSEMRVLIIFLVTAMLWITRDIINDIPGLEGLSDPGIAMLCGLALFLTPSKSAEENLLEWKDAQEGVPWGVLLLFGGGLSLAAAAQSTGLAAWIGNLMPLGLSMALLIIMFTALIIFLTELTSNLATTATFLPIVAIIATQFGFDPLLLTASIAIAASCAFMLPVATPPNAIVFGSELIKVPQMMRAGIVINLIAIVVVTLAGLYLVPLFLI